MNEKKSFKLHKSHKIVCFIVCFVIVFGITSVVAFADTFVIWKDSVFNYTPSFDSTHEYYFPDIYANTDTTLTYPINAVSEDGDVISSLSLVYDFDDNGALFGTSCTAVIDGNTVLLFGNYYVNGDFVRSESFSYSASAVLRGDFVYDEIMDRFLIGNDPPISFNIAYNGNPWFDILTGVVDALDVNIFGTFSYLDIVSTLAGACLAIWLLKMLAGG